jgi:Ca2+-transporting ATPase
VLSRFVVIRTLMAATLMTAGAIGLFLHDYDGAATLARAQTRAVTAVIAFQIFYVLACRSLEGSPFAVGFFTNKTIFVGIGSLLALHAGFVYLPFMNAVFGTAPLTGEDLVDAAVAGAVILPVIGVERWWRARRGEIHPKAAAV